MMGHTFLFRDSQRGRADSAGHWLALLASDAAMLADCANGARSFARMAEQLETLMTERARKGRGKYRETAREAVGALLAREESLASAKLSAPLYPTFAAHLKKKARYGLRLLQAEQDKEMVSGASAMKEAVFCLTLVRETAELCMRYLDPSEQSACRQADEHLAVLEDVCARAQVYGELGDAGGCEGFCGEADEAVGAYRSFLAALDRRAKEGRLLAVMPPAFLVWADGTCAYAHRCLKRLARGKAVPDIADGLDDDVTEAHRAPLDLPADDADDIAEEECCVPLALPADGEGGITEEAHRPSLDLPADGAADTCTEVMRADEAESCAEIEERTDFMMPLVILADSDAGGAGMREEAVASALEVMSDEGAGEETVQAGIERIYAKASDYKNIAAKAVQKKREHTAGKPRPLGRRR